MEDIVGSVNNHNMRLNPGKFSFGMLAEKFLDVMLTKRGIESKSDKCQAIIDMMRPSNIKEVQQLTRHLAALSRFISCAVDKAFYFFARLNKNDRFKWTI